MDLTQLRTFVDVVRQGSFAAVARTRDVDPSSISRSIAALEDELKVLLFNRNTRRLTPTEAGLLYFDRIEPLVDELERAHLLAADTRDAPRGTVRLTSPVSFAQLNIVPILPEFMRRYPDLTIDLILTDVVLDLVVERIDLAVRLGAPADARLIANKLTPMVARVCASPGYLAARGHPREPAELASHDCLLLDMPGFGSDWSFKAKGDHRAQKIPVRGPLRSSNALALKECALAGLGIIMQATWIVGREIREGSLVDIFPQYEVTAATYDFPAAWLLYPSRTYLPLKTRLFIDYLNEKFRRGSPWELADEEPVRRLRARRSS